jgi:hypothetical protein
MRRLVVLWVLPVAFAGSPGASGDVLQLVGTVGPGFTIDLTDANGKHVDVITAGRYQLLVHDLADIHNFALGNKTAGRRLVTTGVEFVGDETFVLDLTPGSYGYACSPHFDIMNGHFEVVAPTPPVTTKPRSLAAKVTAKAMSISATRVTAGPYRLSVADRSRSRNFHLVGPGVDRRTTNKFTGTVTWRLHLVAGRYRYGSDPRLTGRLVVRGR